MIIPTLAKSLALYELHHRSPYSVMVEIHKRNVFWLVCAITAVVTFGVIAFIVRS